MISRVGTCWLLIGVCITETGCGRMLAPLYVNGGTEMAAVQPRPRIRPVPPRQDLTRRPQPLLLAVNIPAFRMDVYRGDSLLARYPVTVGSPRYPTPLGAFEITEVVWNPWWVPPASEWAISDSIMPPGPRNPMGRVKMRLDHTYLVHGTIDSANLGGAASHGCVRLANPDIVQVGGFLHANEYPAPPSEQIKRLIEANPEAPERRIALARHVQLVIRYETVELDGNRVMVYPDIYGLDSLSVRDRVVAVLEAAGLDSTAVSERY